MQPDGVVHMFRDLLYTEIFVVRNIIIIFIIIIIFTINHIVGIIIVIVLKIIIVIVLVLKIIIVIVIVVKNLIIIIIIIIIIVGDVIGGNAPHKGDILVEEISVQGIEGHNEDIFNMSRTVPILVIMCGFVIGPGPVQTAGRIAVQQWIALRIQRQSFVPG